MIWEILSLFRLQKNAAIRRFTAKKVCVGVSERRKIQSMQTHHRLFGLGMWLMDHLSCLSRSQELRLIILERYLVELLL